MTTEKKGPGPAVRIKKFCETPENRISVKEMREFITACKADDAARGVPVGTTISELADSIPNATQPAETEQAG